MFIFVMFFDIVDLQRKLSPDVGAAPTSSTLGDAKVSNTSDIGDRINYSSAEY